MVIEISNRARSSSRDRNPVIVELLTLGLDQARDFDRAVRDFVFRGVSEEEMTRLKAGL